MNKRQLRIGTRRSRLAMAQTRQIIEAIQRHCPGLKAEIVPIVTKGDRFTEKGVFTDSGKGVFIREIETALLKGKVDLAVHSIKDVPIEIRPEFCICAVCKREDPRDALVTKNGDLRSIPSGSVIGTGSERRRYQILSYRSDLKIKQIRGNVDTRIKKMERGDYDAIVLAIAGLKRIGLDTIEHHAIPFSIMLPAAGQGAIAIECRAGDSDMIAFTSFLDDSETRRAVESERAFLAAAGGGCNLPIGVYARIHAGKLTIVGRILFNGGKNSVEGKATGDTVRAEEIGRRLSGELLAKAKI